MKIFDYKFLILLGLTLIIYFIYREVEFLRSKINKLENDIIQQKPLLENVDNNTVLSLPSVDNKPVLSLPTQSSPKSVLNLPTQPSPKLVLSLPTQSPPKPVLSLPTQSPPKPVLSLMTQSSPKLITIDLSPPKISISKNTSSESETTTDLESDSVHLAIYSNDNNSKSGTEDDSLLESANDIEFNYETNKVNQIEIDKIIEEKQSSQSEEKNINKEVLTEAELESMKMPDLKKLSESKQIVLSKKVNGVQKQKTKKELIEEILNKK